MNLIGALATAAVQTGPVAAGGSDIAIPWARPITHARSAAGPVEWSEHEIRWSAPAVCAPIRVPVYVQSGDNDEQILWVEVAPSEPLRDLVILPTDELDLWELQAPPTTATAFHVTIGDIEDLPAAEGCLRAHWRIPIARRPDYVAAAALAGEQLVGWDVLARSAWTTRKIESESGDVVSVIVAGRRFSAATAADGSAEVPIEVPPAVDRATAINRLQSVEFDLAPPPLTTEHTLIAADGSRWLLRTDAHGQPFDGDPPDGADRVSVGVYRWPLAPPPDGGAAAPDTASTPRASWRIGPAVAAGPTLLLGAGVIAATSRSWRGPFSWGGGGAVLGGNNRYAARDGEAAATRRVASLAAWAEGAVTVPVQRVRIVPSVGVGAGAGWRSVAATFRRTRNEAVAGPLATAGLRTEVGRLGFELRALLSSADLGVESSPLAGLASLSWTLGF